MLPKVKKVDDIYSSAVLTGHTIIRMSDRYTPLHTTLRFVSRVTNVFASFDQLPHPDVGVHSISRAVAHAQPKASVLRNPNVISP